MNILYCGDQEDASLYVWGALEEAGHIVTHIKPDEPLPSVESFDVIILSDYPADNIANVECTAITEHISNGKRLVMLGGWESFNGFGRNYYGNPVGDILPVQLQPNDDRVNAYQGLLITLRDMGRSKVSLDWSKPPVICGYNNALAKQGSDVLVEMLPVVSDAKSIRLGAAKPLIIAGNCRKGRVIACLTDLSPHWSGGLTDWGGATVTLRNGVSVGNSYLNLIEFLMTA